MPKFINKNEEKLDIKFDEIDDPFCKRQLFDKNGNFIPNKRCKRFYEENIKNNFYGYKICPYGYICAFFKKEFIPSLIIKNKSNLKLIRGHYNFLNQKIKINDESYLTDLLINDKLPEDFQVRSNTFHDIKNSNNYIKDLIQEIDDNDSSNFKICKPLEKLINKYFQIFDNYDNELNKILKKYPDKEDYDLNNSFLKDRIELYNQTFIIMEKIVNQILKNENNEIEELKNLFGFFHLVDYRIRYYNKLLKINENNTSNSEVQIINLHKEITKLKFMFEHFAKNKQVEIFFQTDNKDDYCVQSTDNIFLVLFILIENAVKYSKLGSYIHIILSKDNNVCQIAINNMTTKLTIDNANDLLKKNFQGSNSVDGNGLGLYIVDEILSDLNINHFISVSNNIFSFTMVFK